MKLPLDCFLLLPLDLKVSFLETYFSKDKKEKEHYFKFVTHSVVGVSLKLSIKLRLTNTVLHLLIMEGAVKYLLSK